tara:strand:+ start:563 stop:1027 length:465 start_codon:yes stop_codon:yes gene_type:complete
MNLRTPNSLIDSLNKTSLDTTDKAPLGGPINAPQYNFETKYSSITPYFIPGTQDQESQLSQSLTITALDVESNEAGVRQGGSGGPNRTNSDNIPSGQYKAIGSSPLPLSPTPGGTALTTREGKEKDFTLNAYTPQNTYMETMIKFRDEAKNKLI